MKLLLRFLVLIVVLLLAGALGGYFYVQQKFEPAPSQLTLSQPTVASRFVWSPDSAVRPVEAHAAMLVPVRLPGCPRTCYLQFDTGAPTTILYRRPLTALRARYPATRLALTPADTLPNVAFELGGAEVRARWLLVRPLGASRVPADTAAALIIGTLGVDLLVGRVLVLDYPRQQFSLQPRVPAALARRATFSPLTTKSRRLLLTAGLGGESVQLVFDSGSSAFSLLTSQEQWERLRTPAAAVRVRPSNSLGRILTTHTAPTAAGLQLGAAFRPLGTVTYVTGTTLLQNLLMRFSGMGGMLGNAAFQRHTVILDLPGQRFGLVSGPGPGGDFGH